MALSDGALHTRLRPLNPRSRYIILGVAVFIVTMTVIFSDSIEDIITGGGGATSSGLVATVTGALTNFVINAINGTGYLGIFGLMLLEATSLPVPSEVILPFAGYLVSIGRIDFWVTVALATSAGVIGGLVDYYIGFILGMKVISNYSSRFFISNEQMQRVQTLFEKHGGVIIFVSRLVPGVRTLASFPAGSARMNVPKFILFTAVGLLRLRHTARLCRRLLRIALERCAFNRAARDSGDDSRDRRRCIRVHEDAEEVGPARLATSIDCRPNRCLKERRCAEKPSS